PLGLTPCHLLDHLPEERPDGELVFAGHGGLEPHLPTFEVPEGTSVAVYSDVGKPLTVWDANHVIAGHPSVPIVHVYQPGDIMPDFTLAPKDDMALRGNYIGTEKNPVPLSFMLDPNMGRVHWAACSTIIE
ncbi:putative adhesin, partial [Streptomyces sp. 2MCAF27]